MIIKGKLTPMLSKCLRTALSSNYLRLLALSRFACAQSKLDILASSYHSIGPAKFKRSRAVQKLLGEQLSAIETLQGKLDPLRAKVRGEGGEGTALQAYVDVYKTLQKAVSSCEINNEWVYNIISWYNLTPLYRTLFERLLRATKEELRYLVRALHAMSAHPRPVFQDLVKESVLGQLYRRLDGHLDVGLLKQLEEVLQAPLNFSKRKYFERYLIDNLEGMLKSLNAGDVNQVSQLIWLFETSIRAMCDDEVMVAKMEKAILTMRLPLIKEDIERMLLAYELKGRVSLPIYEQYLKPHLTSRMENHNDLVRTLKFLVCSEAQDPKFMQVILKKIEGMQTTTCLTPQVAETLHFYVHYLRIKGFKLLLNKNVEREMNQLCHSTGKAHNNISRLVQEKSQKRQGQGQKGNQSYFSNCSTLSKDKLTILSPEEFSKLQLNLGHKLRSLNLKTASIYGKARFCCINMEYCIHQGRGDNSELINIQSECIFYVFNSGRVTREVQIRDEILSHYGVKVNHVNLMLYKTRGRMCEDEYLINRRVASTPY